MSLLWVLLAGVLTLNQACDVIVDQEWTGGFRGKFTCKPTKPQDGWTVTLDFGTPIQKFEIWCAKASPDSGSRIVVRPTNGFANKVLTPGKTLECVFVVRGSKSSIKAQLSGEKAGGNTGGTGGTGPVTNPPGRPDVKSKGKYDYCELLKKSILFYEAQRSGKLPSNKRLSWRGDSAMGDRGHNGEDLTGGWYDAGDHVKFGLPMAWSATVLLWGLIDYKDAYTKCGQYEWMLASVKWPLDWFIKAHPSANELYVQVGDGYADHGFWGPPEKMNMARPSFKITPGNPGSDVAGEYAAAMAAGYIAFKDVDAGYAGNLLRHAKEIFNFADKHRGKYQIEGRVPAKDFYNSQSIEDDLAWAAAWLYRATNDKNYLNKAMSMAGGEAGWGFSWDEQWAGLNVLLYQLTKDGTRKGLVESYVKSWMPQGGIHYTPKGLAWRIKWGSNRYAANSAFVALRAADLGINGGYFQWGEKQIGYMLGDGGRSYVCGFGNNPPRQPHHRASSCRINGGCTTGGQPNPNVLYGALVGGPGANDDYQDSRDDYVKNEVADDYNAGFQSAIAALQNRAG